jgi:hypothetical protein
MDGRRSVRRNLWRAATGFKRSNFACLISRARLIQVEQQADERQALMTWKLDDFPT